MKFKLNDGEAPFSAYGYKFSDEATDVKEENLIAKFEMYHQLKAVKMGRPKVEPKAEPVIEPEIEPAVEIIE